MILEICYDTSCNLIFTIGIYGIMLVSMLRHTSYNLKGVICRSTLDIIGTMP